MVQSGREGPNAMSIGRGQGTAMLARATLLTSANRAAWRAFGDVSTQQFRGDKKANGERVRGGKKENDKSQHVVGKPRVTNR